MSKVFKDVQKTSLHNDCKSISAEFSKFAGKKRGKTVPLYFGDVIIPTIMSALKS